MKIYTKKGDKGKTTLVSGKSIEKTSEIVEAYGTVDELIAQVGLIESFNIDNYFKDICFEIQNKLMLIAANIADIRRNKTISNITEEDVLKLEKEIDFMDEQLEPLKNFILFKGAIVSTINGMRTLTRRCERRVLSMENITSNPNINLIIKYLNRLSDFFFTLARYSCLKNERCQEIKWTD